MVRCPNCEMETFLNKADLEDEGCPWCGYVGVIESQEPPIVVQPPPITRIVTPNYRRVMRYLDNVGWTGVGKEIRKASKALSEKRNSDCCNNLRMALATLLTKVSQELSPQEIKVEPGKTIDIGQLTQILKTKGVPDDSVGLISRVWSYLSDRAHVEKKGGSEPTSPETLYGFQMSFATFEFLLRLREKFKRTQ